MRPAPRRQARTQVAVSIIWLLIGAGSLRRGDTDMGVTGVLLGLTGLALAAFMKAKDSHYLDQHPVVAAVVVVTGAGVVVAAFVFADDLWVVLAFLIALLGTVVSGDAARSLIRVYRRGRDGAGAPDPGRVIG